MCGMFPQMTSLHYVLPRARHENRTRREPHGSFDLEGRIVELPGRIMIPLLNEHVAGEGPDTESN